MTTIYFLRHGMTQENSDVRIQGQRHGTLLLPETERYLAGIVPLLRQGKISVLVSSDLDRAITTRKLLKQFLHDPTIKEVETPLLRERAMGYYEGMLWEDVPTAFQAQRQSDEYDFRSFGGEHVDDVRQRVRYTLAECGRRYPHHAIGCITHAGWLQQLVWLARATHPVGDHWSDRTGVYQAEVNREGTLVNLQAIPIEARVVA